MGRSNTAGNTPDKPDKYVPTDDEKAMMSDKFGIGWHVRGGWCRKFPGEVNRSYFGHVPPAEAVEAHNAEKERREQGAQAAVKLTGLRLGEALNRFLTHLDKEYADGNIREGQRASHGRELDILATTIGPTTRLARFTEMDAPDTIFRPLRAAAVARGLQAAEKHVKRVREFLTWCSDTRRFITAPFYGGAFDPPSEKQKKAFKKGERKKRGVAFWEPAEVRQLVDAAAQVSPHFYAQILLVLNGGMGATDLSHLTDTDVDWDRKCIHTDRSKTLVPRVVPLWDVTLEAMKRSRAERPNPSLPEYADRFFLTPHGLPLVLQRLNPGTPGKKKDRPRTKVLRTDAVRNTFYRLLNPPKAKRTTARRWEKTIPCLPGLKRHRAGFYTLRGVFTTLSLGHGQDRNLEAIILGQQFDRPILEYYIRDEQREKLRAVVEHVRCQVWPDQG